MAITFASENIPVPTTTRGARTSKYPFIELLVGESFLVSGEHLPKKPVESIRAAVYAFNKVCKDADVDTRKFIVRTEGEGVRVWRTA